MPNGAGPQRRSRADTRNRGRNRSCTSNSHTDWHRCIVWGKLADYAKTLKKGAHLAIEGELRSRERTD